MFHQRYWIKDASGNVFGPYHSVDEAIDAAVECELSGELSSGWYLSGELSSSWYMDSNSDPDTEDLLQR